MNVEQIDNAVVDVEPDSRTVVRFVLPPLVRLALMRDGGKTPPQSVVLRGLAIRVLGQVLPCFNDRIGLRSNEIRPALPGLIRREPDPILTFAKRARDALRLGHSPAG
ncbi:hypothetical protein ACOCJ7_05000 [Knoellia sp. CPCC 206453]|uniref:hypothetical protein n=1 Tax=Knoellia pratensis TaxID=3404796 RepID=UPI003B43620E